MPLSEHVFCVPITFKLLSEASNKSVSNSALSLNIPPWKLFRWFRRPQLWATGDWQLHHNNVPAQHACSCITSPAEFFWQNSKSPRWLSAPSSPDLVPCDFWLFPKLKSPLKEKRFQTIDEIQENTTGQLVEIPAKILPSVLNNGRDAGRTVWGPKVPTLRGTEMSLSYLQCFLYCISFNKCLYFSEYMAWYFRNRAHKPIFVGKITV